MWSWICIASGAETANSEWSKLPAPSKKMKVLWARMGGCNAWMTYTFKVVEVWLTGKIKTAYLLNSQTYEPSSAIQKYRYIYIYYIHIYICIYIMVGWKWITNAVAWLKSCFLESELRRFIYDDLCLCLLPFHMQLMWWYEIRYVFNRFHLQSEDFNWVWKRNSTLDY
jgi:hypothetical protein